ncbi:dihydrofolate reductase family protein [Flavobacterium sp. J372]|uniref:dihydrofolate reductase family protein n=1 Tax=Flavobacterium sp. J372 TaxID=2898436 RepID=UPI002150F2B3|nr:dihydrofolate reductase family protein [Flavobacterium sp. J372]MCR5861538.1 dihydrofolate reductase family protein [Flavobacterium sp. J372]
MRKLKLQVQISVDGFIAGPQGAMDWIEWNWGDDINAYVSEITRPVDTILLGRKLAEGFIPTWEERAKEPDAATNGSEKFTQTPKVVFSRSMSSSPWERTRIANELVANVNELKNSNGGNIMAYGGGEFVSSLIREGLIDEFYLFINPTILGTGMPIFSLIESPQKLKLIEAKTFSCGITVLHYSTL